MSPKSNSAATISLFPSTPEQESVSSSGVFPDKGLTERPRHVGITFVEVGVGVGVSVGVSVPVGVSVGVISSARFRSSKVDVSFRVMARTLMTTPKKRIKRSIALGDKFFVDFFIVRRFVFIGKILNYNYNNTDIQELLVI